MKAYERKQLLERVGREGATVGSRIPERIEVLGEPVDLRAFVFEIKRRDTASGERDRVASVKRRLRRERRARLRRIETGDIPYEEGEELVESILGLDRALNAIESLDSSSDLEAEASAQAAADQKRWVSFLRQVLGDEDGRRSRP